MSIEQRILETADRLYAQSEPKRFPTVDTVRRAVGADANTVTRVMRQWRERQTQAAQLASALPKTLRQTIAVSMAQVWEEAQALATAQFTEERKAWSQEREAFVAADEARQHEVGVAIASYTEAHTRADKFEALATQIAARLEGLEADIKAAYKARDAAQRAAASAREHSASLQGQLDTLTASHQALISTLQSKPAPRRTTKKKTATKGKRG